MQYRTLGRTGLQISAVAYGGIVSMHETQEDSDRFVSWAMEQGVNYFDVAPSYADAQLRLGNSLIPYRDRIHLACKTAQRMRKEAEEELLGSMKLLHTDHFEVYQLHGVSSVEEVETAFGKGGVMEMVSTLKEKGIAKNIGFTAHNEEAALRLLELYDFDTVLFPFNWLMNINLGFGNRLMEKAKSRNMGVLCMKAFIERKWLDREERNASAFPKSWCKPIDPEDVDFGRAAMRYSLSLGADALIPPGNFRSFSFGVNQIDACLANPLSDEERAFLKRKAESCRGLEFFSLDGKTLI